jgi:hypothetical protein
MRYFRSGLFTVNPEEFSCSKTRNMYSGGKKLKAVLWAAFSFQAALL